jgi:hypothetical protein
MFSLVSSQLAEMLLWRDEVTSGLRSEDEQKGWS